MRVKNANHGKEEPSKQIRHSSDLPVSVYLSHFYFELNVQFNKNKDPQFQQQQNNLTFQDSTVMTINNKRRKLILSNLCQ